MPSQFFNFSRYFKKGKDDKDEDAQKTEVNEATISSSTPADVQYSGTRQAYSGIGNPPSPVVKKTPLPQTNQTDGNIGANSLSNSANTPAANSSIDHNKRVGMDVLSRFTQRSNKVLLVAANKVKELKNQYIDTEHVLWGLLQDSSVYQLISECKVTPSELQASLEKIFKHGNFTGVPQFSPRVKRVLELSLSTARSLGYEFISPEHILLALSHEGEGAAAQTLVKNNLTREVLNKKITGKKEIEKEEDNKRTSTLELYTEDLTSKALRGELDPVVGRSWEIERIIHILSRRTKNNPVLIGDAGVGKTAIVEGLALRIANGNVPETLLHKKILLLDLMSLIAGARHRGEFEERLKNLIKEVKASSGGIILFIDELHNMVGAGSGSEGTMDASNILKPSLARGELQTIGTTTVTEYRKYIEKDPALERRFQPVNVSEPTAEIAIEMLLAIRDKYEAFHRVKISDEAVEAAVRLSQRYIGDRFLPDKAVDLIDEGAASVRLPAISLPEEIKSQEEKLKKLTSEQQEAEKIGDRIRIENLKKELEDLEVSLKNLKDEYQIKKSTTTNTVTPEIIAEIVSRWTNIPIKRLTENESAKLLDLEEVIHKRLIDQDEAVTAVAEAVRRGRAGLKSNKRPIGSFIFMGPMGVGKTELAKTLAETLFGSEDLMVRVDMTEYMEKHEVAKLIGAPPGYVGYEEGGQLTEAVRRHPYSVVLLDEIEKAHPDVFNILIQLLDDGRLTDNKGHTISFKNTIVICTSNLGSGIIQEEMSGWKNDTDKQDADAANQKQDIFTTYTISPTGREIITLKDRVWERDARDNKWKSLSLTDYFAGSAVLEGENVFPAGGINTHLIAPDGSETITKGDLLWFRTSTIMKEWKVQVLLLQTKDHLVTNALPDKPEEQLPTAKWDTHAISTLDSEMITLDNRFWKRENLKTQEWVTDILDKYFEGAVLEKEMKESEDPDKKMKSGNNLINRDTSKNRKENFPTRKWDIHLFRSAGEELIISDGEYWQRKDAGTAIWQSGSVADLFTVKDVLGEKEESKIPVFQEMQSVKEEKDNDRFNLLADRLMEELKKFFKPELLNRYDEIVIFKPLTREHMLEIVNLQVKILGKLLEEQNVRLKMSENAKLFLSQVGFDPVFGARPLRRTMQRLVENPVSSMLIKGEVVLGDTIVVDSDGDGLTFDVEKMAPRKSIPAPVDTSKTQEETPKDDNGIIPTPPGFKCEKCGYTWEKAAGEKDSKNVCPKCQSELTVIKNESTDSKDKAPKDLSLSMDKKPEEKNEELISPQEEKKEESPNPLEEFYKGVENSPSTPSDKKPEEDNTPLSSSVS